MTKHEEAGQQRSLEAFLAKKAALDALPTELQQASAEHFGADPEAVLWGETAWLADGISIRAADMPGADDPMMRVYAAMAQKERQLISDRTRAALTAAKARGRALGGDRGYRPAAGPDAAAAALARGVPTPRSRGAWTHTTVGRVLQRATA